MNIPTIRGTTAPSVPELQRAWSIVVAHRFPSEIASQAVGYLGRIVDDGKEDGLITLEDPFDYDDHLELRPDPETRKPVGGWMRHCWPVLGFDVKTIRVIPAAIIPLADVNEKQVETIRKALIPAWESRERLREQGGRVTLAGPGTKIEPTR